MTHLPSPVRAAIDIARDLNSHNGASSKWCQQTLGYLPEDAPRRTAACGLLIVAALSGMPLKRPVPEFNQMFGNFAAAERMLARATQEPRPGPRMPFAFESEDGQRLG